MSATKTRALVAESLGTALLLAVVVGSGIMGDRLSEGNSAIALLANSVATGTALVALIFTFAPLSGAHFNPAVSLVFALKNGMSGSEFAARVFVQALGAVFGVLTAHYIFSEPLVSISQHDRSTFPLYVSEFVATFGLISVILGTLKNSPQAVPFVVGAYITAAYWFTSSTSFANPAVTLARTLTNTFSGIAPSGLFGFVVAQVLGAICAWKLWSWFYPQQSGQK